MSVDDELLQELVAQWVERRQHGPAPDVAELCPENTALQDALRRAIERQLRIEAVFQPEPQSGGSQYATLPESKAGRPQDASAVRGDIPIAKVARLPGEMPEQIGRYRIDRELGRGAFGIVYLARDEQLGRQVAVKIPHPDLAARLREPKAYLTEARALAGLDHPHIVPIYDAGSAADFPCFIVSKFIDGTDLGQKLKQGPLPFDEAARLVAVVAQALHSAHKRGTVHRDIKPANILLSRSGEPFVVDFGLALREEDAGTARRVVGTPAYMSPEQARGESHRVDGRSDIFSLGVVLYELLTGRRPFREAGDVELLNQIATADPKPPRQIDDGIPRELERICLKALAKRAADRYSTAADLAEDLDSFMSGIGTLARTKFVPIETSARAETNREIPASPAPRTDEKPSDTPVSPLPAIPIVPKGLRAFDEHDSDFFLELLPGPRDRDGLPESLRFWKTRIEQTDADKTFAVGLLYGPSGCGKSSLVKAGLLPRLASNVLSVAVEATADQTEVRLLNGLRKRCPGLPPGLGLRESIAALRQASSLPAGCKVLLVLDQFEQWLHAHQNRQESELVLALRQCDGTHVQGLVIVRDDFWMAATRFMWELENRLVERENSSAVDLFPVRHARRVLRFFGRAFGALPDSDREADSEHEAFIEQAVGGLAENGQIVCVRLALFAEMFKNRPWTPAALRSVGGISGVGVTYLDETFSSPYAPPRHRVHQAGAQAVLRALLPDPGTEIKGHMRSYSELLLASGYAGRQDQFDDLLRLLDTELRMITPTDPEGTAEKPELIAMQGLAARHYQLTHDYFVPSLREWLTHKQKETARGRAALQLAEAAADWSRRPVKRLLPSLSDFLRWRLLTSARRWSEAERNMMAQAARRHLLRGAASCALLLLVVISVVFSITTKHSEALRQQLTTTVDAAQNNRGAAVPYAIRDLKKLPSPLVRAELQARYDRLPDNRKLGLAYARAEYGDVDVQFLISQVGAAQVEEFDNLLTALHRARAAALSHCLEEISANRERENWRAAARLAILALYLEEEGPALDLCRTEQRPDPIQRTIFIDEFPRWHGNLERLSPSQPALEAASFRSALCLGLAGISPDHLTPDEQQAWQSRLTDWHRLSPDPATHSAADVAIRRWHVELPFIEPSPGPVGNRDWFVNSRGMTMLKIAPGSFSRHPPETPDSSPDGRQTITLSRTIFLCDREVSVRDYLDFINDVNWPDAQRPPHWQARMKRFEVDPALVGPEYPVQFTSWLDAACFCNWLSAQEERSPCYVSTGRVLNPDDLREPTYVELEITNSGNGYRLPTEAEWEYACRAGSTTDFSCGSDGMLLRQYAVFRSVQIEQRGTLFPNQWGLFDMHGNAYEWCADRFVPYPTADLIDPVVTTGFYRVFRGGGFLDASESCRSAQRSGLAPWIAARGTGFRVVLPVETGASAR